MKTISSDLKNKSGIYKIYSIFGGFYIGSSVNLYTRLCDHQRKLFSATHYNRGGLQYNFDKYGPEALDYEILEFCVKTELLQKEQHYIDTLNPDFNIRRIVNREPKMTIPEALKILDEAFLNIAKMPEVPNTKPRKARPIKNCHEKHAKD